MSASAVPAAPAIFPACIVVITGKLFVCDGWSGEASTRINSYYSNGGTVDSTYGQVVTLQNDLSCTAGGSFTGKLYQGPMDISYTDSCLIVFPNGWRTSSSEAFVTAVSEKLVVATGRVEMPMAHRNYYTAAGTEILMDLYHGYIQVEADSLGEMIYETSRSLQ